MTNKIHPLQEATVHLLDALYKDEHLPVTQAMLSIQNGYYPDVRSILSTLHRYAEEKLVLEFSERNDDLIQQARMEIEHQKTEREEENASKGDASPEDIFGFSFEIVKPYELMKSIALVDIEKAFSVELSRLCNEELVLTIESIQSHEKSLGSWTEMKITVKAKQRFR